MCIKFQVQILKIALLIRIFLGLVFLADPVHIYIYTYLHIYILGPPARRPSVGGENFQIVDKLRRVFPLHALQIVEKLDVWNGVKLTKICLTGNLTFWNIDQLWRHFYGWRNGDSENRWRVREKRISRAVQICNQIWYSLI